MFEDFLNTTILRSTNQNDITSSRYCHADNDKTMMQRFYRLIGQFQIQNLMLRKRRSNLKSLVMSKQALKQATVVEVISHKQLMRACGQYLRHTLVHVCSTTLSWLQPQVTWHAPGEKLGLSVVQQTIAYISLHLQKESTSRYYIIHFLHNQTGPHL